MPDQQTIRDGEQSVETDHPTDAALRFIGRINTPWRRRADCPRQGRPDGPECTIEIFEPWGPALRGLERYDRIEVLYWLHHSRRDLVLQNPAHDGQLFGTFALRSPVRPNPIGTAMVSLVALQGLLLTVRGLDCLDGTPLVDIKPDRCAFSPKAPPKPGS